MVFVKWPTGHDCQVWTNNDGSKMFIYDMAQWLEYTQSAGNDGKVYWPTWTKVDWDDDMWVYDTNNPTELFTWESGDKVSYVFKNYDGTVLKEGKVDEGTAPTPPADPTRPATAQYTYTFAWWNPEVAPITKKTTYTATYTATVNEYTITWVDWDGNTLDTDTVAYGDTPEYTWATPTKTATAQYTYTWDEWWTPSVVAVTGDATYTATFTATVNQYTVTIQSNNTDYGTVDESSVTVDYGTAISVSNNVLTIWTTEITATAETGYEFSSWGTLPETVTEDLSITATFEASWYLLTFTPRDESTDTQGGGSLSSSSYTVTQPWLYLYYNNGYDDNLRILTDPTNPTTTTINMIVPTPDTVHYLDGWYYYDETQQDWVDVESQIDWVRITWDMQIRCYFGS